MPQATGDPIDKLDDPGVRARHFDRRADRWGRARKREVKQQAGVLPADDRGWGRSEGREGWSVRRGEVEARPATVQPSTCLGIDCVAYPVLLTMKVTRPGITPFNVYAPLESVVVLSPWESTVTVAPMIGVPGDGIQDVPAEGNEGKGVGERFPASVTCPLRTLNGGVTRSRNPSR